MFRRPMTSVFLGQKGAFDSVDRATRWRCLSMKGVRNSLHFSNLCMETGEVEFLLAAISHSSSPREVMLFKRVLSPFAIWLL